MNSHEADRAVTSVFAPYLVDGLEPEPNFSVRFEDASPDKEGIRPFQILYKSDCAVIRTRRRSRVIRALRTSLARHAGEGSDLLMLRQVVLVFDGRAILMPPDLLPRVEEIEDGLRGQGVEVLDSGFMHLDPATGEIVVPKPALRVDADALRQIDGADPAEGVDAAAGRFRVAHWGILRRDAEKPLRRMDVFAAVMPSLEDEADLSMQEAMGAVSKALATASVGSIRHQSGEQLLRSLMQITTAI